MGSWHAGSDELGLPTELPPWGATRFVVPIPRRYGVLPADENRHWRAPDAEELRPKKRMDILPRLEHD
jgi:hypothetical protein